MKEAGTRHHRIRKREKVLFDLLNSSLAQLGPERNGQTLNGIALKLAERFARRCLNQTSYRPLLHNPRFWEVQQYLSLARVSMHHHFECHHHFERLAALALGVRPCAKLYRLVEHHALDRVPLTGHGSNRLLERL